MCVYMTWSRRHFFGAVTSISCNIHVSSLLICVNASVKLVGLTQQLDDMFKACGKQFLCPPWLLCVTGSTDTVPEAQASIDSYTQAPHFPLG